MKKKYKKESRANTVDFPENYTHVNAGWPIRGSQSVSRALVLIEIRN